MNTNPLAVTASAYFTTSTRFVLPAFAIAPSDFSRIVVNPPALLPGDGLLLISRAVLGGVVLPPFHQRDHLLADVPAHGTAREQVLGAVGFRRFRQDGRAAVPHQRSLATPSAGLAETPE